MSVVLPRRKLLEHGLVSLGLGFLIAAQGLAMVASKSERWVGHWPNSSAVVGWSGLWGACFTAGAAAWVFAAPRRHRYRDLLLGSSRSQARVYLGATSSVAIGSVLGYLIVLGYVVSMTAPRATHGGPSLVELLSAGATVPMAIGIGAAVGRVVPPVVAPVVAGVAPYVLYMGLVYADAYGGQVVFADLLWIDQVDRTYLRLPTELLVSRVVLWSALGIALLAWTLRSNRLAYGSTVAAGFALSGVLLTAGVRIDAPSEYAVTCVDGRPRVCVDRAHDHLLNEYQSRATSGLSRIPGFDLSAITIVQQGNLFEHSIKYAGEAPPVGHTRQVPVPIVKRNTAPAHEIADDTFTASLGFALLVPCSFPTGDSAATPPSARGMDTALALYAWWLKHNALPTDGSNYPGEVSVASVFAENKQLADNAQRFASLSERERAAWFSQNGDSVLSCAATPSW